MTNLTIISTLITANHILHYHNILDGLGHISVRNPSNPNTYFLAVGIAPSVVSNLEDIGEYLVEDSSPVNGTQGGYAERYIHSEILKRYPDVNSIVHSHNEDVLPYTVLEGVDIEPVYHMAGFLGESVPNFDIEDFYEENDARDMLVNSLSLGAALATTFETNSSQPTSPLHTAVLQRGHGFVTVGASIEQAVDYAYYAASNARIQTKALLLAGAVGGSGGVKYLNAVERRDSKNMNAWVASRPWRQWVQEVERSGVYENALKTPAGG